jgi:hypothetical protein
VFNHKVIRSIYDLGTLDQWWLSPEKQGAFQHARPDQQTKMDQDDSVEMPL